MLKVGIVVGLVVLVADYPPAKPDGAWFKSLKQPGSGISCCDIADCHKTEAEWRGNQWWAKVDGEMVPVPGDKVLKNKQSVDGEAYICTAESQVRPRLIYCFVPKNMGF